MAPGRFRKRDDDRPDERRPAGGDLIEALDRARAAAAQGGVSGGEHRRRLAAAIRDASIDELAAAAASLSTALGAPPAGDARAAALERLTELRAAGSIGEEDFARETRRILGQG